MSSTPPINIDVEIIGQPIFWIKMDAATVDVLIKLALRHYDSKCKQSARLGGFLWGWRNTVNFNAESSCRATWDNLDTSLKICENAEMMLDAAQLRLIAAYRARVLVALDAARAVYDTWRKKL